MHVKLGGATMLRVLKMFYWREKQPITRPN